MYICSASEQHRNQHHSVRTCAECQTGVTEWHTHILQHTLLYSIAPRYINTLTKCLTTANAANQNTPSNRRYRQTMHLYGRGYNKGSCRCNTAPARMLATAEQDQVWSGTQYKQEKAHQTSRGAQISTDKAYLFQSFTGAPHTLHRYNTLPRDL